MLILHKDLMARNSNGSMMVMELLTQMVVSCKSVKEMANGM
jgi:hypothetical protein